MRTRHSLAALGLVAALAFPLAGCSLLLPSGPTTQQSDPATDGGDSSTIDADPATGVVVSGSGYTFNAPDKWTIAADAPSIADTYVISDVDDSDGFTDTINVILSPAGEVTADQIEALGTKELEGSGATNVEILPRVTIADSESAHFTATFHSGSTDYQIEQYYPSHDGQTFIITFSFGENFPAADRVAIAESVLATWAWS